MGATRNGGGKIGVTRERERERRYRLRRSGASGRERAAWKADGAKKKKVGQKRVQREGR